MRNDQDEREWFRASECAWSICNAIEESVHRMVFGYALRWR